MPDDGWRSQERMELITFAPSPGIPHEAAALLERGAPKAMFGLYRAADALTLIETTDGRRLVCFGSLAYQGRACLDPQTGAVVYLLDLRGGVGRGGDEWLVELVNSSLEQFIASVDAVLNRYPFARPQAKHESDESYLDRRSAELQRAVDDLRQALSAIDAPAIADPGRFWLDFTDDVYMGSYSTDDDLDDDSC